MAAGLPPAPRRPDWGIYTGEARDSDAVARLGVYVWVLQEA